MQYVRFNYAEKDLSLKRCSARLERTVRISMAIRKIFTDDAECLYKVCRPVEHFNKRLNMRSEKGIKAAAAKTEAMHLPVRGG